MVGGFRVGCAQVRNDFREEQLSQRFRRRVKEQRPESVEERSRVDNVLSPEQDERTHQLVSEFGVQARMVQLQQTAEVFGERSGQSGIAVGDMADEIDQVLESDHAAVVCGRGRLQEKLAQTGILVELRLEVLLVGERVVADLVLQVRQIGIDLFQRGNLSLHDWYVLLCCGWCCECKGRGAFERALLKMAKSRPRLFSCPDFTLI